jgi:hypothetical protein
LNKNIFSDGQAFVGLSRAAMSEKLFLTQLDFDAIKEDPEAIAEYERLKNVSFTIRVIDDSTSRLANVHRVLCPMLPLNTVQFMHRTVASILRDSFKNLKPSQLQD